MITKFEFKKTEIEGFVEITPFNAEDVRGCFTKDYSKEVFEANGIRHDLAEVFYTTSHKGVIRALHFQRVKQQPKLVRCIYGHVWDVVVDLRKDSSTFKKWLAFDLYGTMGSGKLTDCGIVGLTDCAAKEGDQSICQSDNQTILREILVPAGCAHGYLVLEDSIVSYKCGEKFYGEYDDGIMWNDPEIGVQWPLEKIGGLEKVILADKDKNLQSFSEFLAKENGGF